MRQRHEVLVAVGRRATGNGEHDDKRPNTQGAPGHDREEADDPAPQAWAGALHSNTTFQSLMTP